jgi:hypothetical protein
MAAIIVLQAARRMKRLPLPHTSNYRHLTAKLRWHKA